MRRGRQKMSCRRQIADVIVGRPFLGVDIITSKHFGKSNHRKQNSSHYRKETFVGRSHFET